MRIYKQEKRAIVLTVFSVVVGLYLGLTYDGKYFSQSGAVIVCIAIIFAVSYIEENLGTLKSRALSIASKKKEDTLNYLNKIGVDENTAKEAYNDLTDTLSDDFDTYYIKFKKRALRIEASLLILGTLIWAFGELVNSKACVSQI